uniref:Uncharacterized protein n=1 Tax=Mola mola TaxID=94237 RepID=A0A3Q3WJ87_MOLML
SRMQTSADQVEKNILQSEELLKKLPMIHQKVNADNLVEAEALLKDLFMDVDKSKRLQHPQAAEIERDVKNLHDRWAKDCATFRELYNQMPDLDPKQKINWGPLLDEKLKQLKLEPFGPSLADVEKQIAAHNILHQAIEAYSSQLTPSSNTSQVRSSLQRRSNLASLYEYLQSCSKERIYLSGQQDRIVQRDWSDLMVDPQSVRMEYEKFKKNGLLAHESEVNKLQDQGDRLVDTKHPGTPANRDAVQTEWQAFLNLCLAQETHLDNIEEYKKFQLDAETLSDSLKRLNSTLDPKSLANKSNPEVLLVLERLAALRELSTNVMPLKLRRLQPTKLTTGVALCDWMDTEVGHGEKMKVMSNADFKNWELQTIGGKTRTLPGACFMIPPPDPEAMETVDRYREQILDRALRDLKNRRSALVTSLRNSTEVARPQRAVTTKSAPEDPKAAELNNEIDRINRALDQCEKQILHQLRVPLDNCNPTKDLENRLQKHEKSAQTVRRLESEKFAIQREMEPILTKKPLGPTTSSLPLKLSATNDKLDDVNTIINLYSKKISASMFLERQMQSVDGIISGFEEQLAKDGAILDVPKALQNHNQQLQVLYLTITDFDMAEQACGPLQRSFNEYCPDIRRQENEVKSIVASLSTNKNQDFQNALQSLDFFLVNLPNNTIKPTDDVAQNITKQNSQMEYEVKSNTYPALSILSCNAQNNEKVSQVIISQQLQLQSQKRDQEESDILKNELNEEIARRMHAEKDLETYRKRFVHLKRRRGVERTEEKEVVQYYRDPKLELELQSLKNRIQEEAVKRSRSHSEISIYNEKIVQVEMQLRKIEPKLVTKVVTEYERDPQLDKEAAKIRDEMQRIRLVLQTRDTETVHVKTELRVLAQQKPKIRQKVVTKEVVRYEKDPDMLKNVLILQGDIAAEESQCKVLHKSIFSTRSKINALETIIPTIQPQIITKVLKQVQQDPETVEESKKLRMALEEEKDENVILMKDLTTLQLHYGELDKLRPKVEVKQIINEIYRVDPETEVELIRLRKELQESSRNRIELEREIKTTTADLTTLRAQKPKVEYKEVTQQVIKEEKSPEIIRELQRLNNQVSRLQVNCDSTLELLTHLRKERDELKAEKSKVETKLVNKEVIKYENDPLLEKEADRLRRTIREEIQQRRSLEECLFDLQNQYIVLERQKPEEKIIMQEMLRVQKDPKQIQEHEKLNKSLDEEVKSRRKLELEVRQLRALVQEKETTLAQMDDRQKKIQAESELRQIKSRILELENAPPPIEEKIVIEEVHKVEKDPQLEKLTDDIRADLEIENTNISRLKREIRNLKVKLDILHKDKSVEKVVYREVVRVEKDPAVEAEREHLRELVTQERNLRRDMEDNAQNINIKITHLQTSKSMISQEETVLISNRDALQKEKEEFLKQLKILESEQQSITVTFQQQSRLMSERNQLARQRSLKTSSEMQRLEKEIVNEKDKIQQKDMMIMELQNNIKKEDQSETHTRETNLSTKITIMDPETGKDMSPYEAYMQGLIDRNHYIHLSELECDWEEITSNGPDGDSTILQDRKSGKQYSVKDAVKDGRLSQYDLKRYKEGELHISEFALLVAGETKHTLRSSYPSLNSQHSTSQNNLSASAGEDNFPISGVLDTTTQSRMSVRSALTRKLIDNDTALKLLEAQAASGGIIDLTKKDKLSVHKAVEHGLIDQSHMYKLLNAQKAFTGVEDPATKERLAVRQAAQKGYMPQENAMRYMVAQYLTGGLVDPSKAGRLTIQEALAANLIDGTTAGELQDEASYKKELVDPITKDKISYKQAMDRCKRDMSTGLLLLPVASTDASNAPSYSNYRFSSLYSK